MTRRTTLRYQGRIVSRRWYWLNIGKQIEPPRPREPRYRYEIAVRSRFHCRSRYRLVNMTITSERGWMLIKLKQRTLTIFPEHP